MLGHINRRVDVSFVGLFDLVDSPATRRETMSFIGNLGHSTVDMVEIEQAQDQAQEGCHEKYHAAVVYSTIG